MSLERDVLIGLKWGTMAKVVSQVSSWLMTLAVLRLLTPEDYGLVALCMVAVTLLAGLAEFGLGSSMVQTATLGQKDLENIAGAVVVLNVCAGLTMALGAPILANWLGDGRLTTLLEVLSLHFLFSAIDTVPYSIAHRDMRFKRLAGVEVSVAVVGALLTLALAWEGAGVWALIVGNLASAGLRAALYVSLGGFIRPSFNFRRIGSHMRFGGTVTITRLIWQITSQADVLIAGRLFSSKTVGLYSVSTYLATLPMAKVMGILNQIAFPAVARLQEEMGRLAQQLLRSFRLLAAAAIPAMWGMSAVADEFVDVILGDQWQPAGLPLQVISFVTPLRMLQAVFATALFGVGRADVELKNTIVGALVLPVAFLFGAREGLNGLALSWLLGVPCVLALNLSRTIGVFGLAPSRLLAAFRGPLLGGITMYGVVTGTRLLLLDAQAWIRLPLLVATGGIVYLLVIRLVDLPLWTDFRKLSTALRG